YLASDESQWITGTGMIVDGGLTVGQYFPYWSSQLRETQSQPRPDTAIRTGFSGPSFKRKLYVIHFLVPHAMMSERATAPKGTQPHCNHAGRLVVAESQRRNEVTIVSTVTVATLSGLYGRTLRFSSAIV